MGHLKDPIENGQEQADFTTAKQTDRLTDDEELHENSKNPATERSSKLKLDEEALLE